MNQHPDDLVVSATHVDRDLFIRCFIYWFHQKPLSQPKLPAGIDFENAVAKRLTELGYTTRETQTTGDFGADIVAEKDDLVYVLQCKDTQSPAGIKAVQEAATARRYYKGDYAVVVSSGGYTKAARETASEVDVALIDLGSLHLMEDLCR